MENRYITVQYKMYAPMGEEKRVELIEQTRDDMPFMFISGMGRVLEVLEQKLVPLQAGEQFKIVLSEDEAPFFSTSGKSPVRSFKPGDVVSLSRGVDGQGGGLNGDILLGDGTPLTGKTAICGKSLKVKAVPAPGFRFSKLVIRHGRNLDGEKQHNWTETTIGVGQFRNGEFKIPGSVVDGDMRFIPYFSSESAK